MLNTVLFLLSISVFVRGRAKSRNHLQGLNDMHMKENKMRDVLHISRAWLIAALALFASATLAGADDALYADVPPEDAVFVRWLGYDDIPADARQIYGSELPSDAVKGDAYTAISAASLDGATPVSYTHLTLPTKA